MRWAALAVLVGACFPSPAHAAPTEDPGADALELDASWLVVVWSEGEVGWRPEARREASAFTAVIGERLDAGTLVEVSAAGRIILLAGGDRLVSLDGPGRWLLEPGRLTPLPVHPEREAVKSPRPRLELLDGYGEGPAPLLEPMSSQPMLIDEALPMTLALVDPLSPASRTDQPVLRWHWPYEDGRFDVLLEQLEASSHEPTRLVERWRNLAGRTHTPFAPLPRGHTYRVVVSYADPHGNGASPIVDQRTFHVLTAEAAGAVDATLARLEAQQSEPRRPELDVLRARLLESHGLWDEAEQVWTGLSLKHPGHDDLLSHALRLHGLRHRR